MADCTYCGSPFGTDRDHIIPRAISAEWRRKTAYKSETVISCRECNSLLGDKLFTTISSRAAYLLGVYQSRYSKLLNMPDWNEEDLDEVGYSLRSSLETSLRERDNVKARIMALEALCYGLRSI